MSKVNKEERFVKTHSQENFARSLEVWVDKQTGVNYLYCTYGNTGGLTPLLDRDGKPIVTTVYPEEK